MADDETDQDLLEDPSDEEPDDDDLVAEPSPAPPLLGTVAIVGFPNVG